MALITYPSAVGFPGFTTYTLKLQRKTIQLQSPFSGARQVIAQPYALWAFQGKYVITDETQAGLLRAFLTLLEGTSNYFKFFLPGYTALKSGYSGALNVNGASQTGKSLICNGATPSITNLVQPGDYVVINGAGFPELKMITANASSDVSGNITISFEPAIRVSPTTATAVVISNPYVMLQSVNDDNASWDMTPPLISQFELNCLEVPKT